MSAEPRLPRAVFGSFFLAVAVAAGAAAAGPLGEPVTRATTGSVLRGLGLAALAAAAAWTAGWLGWMVARGEPEGRQESTRRAHVLLTVVALPAAGGLLWPTARLALDVDLGLAWLTGGAALAVLLAWAARLLLTSRSGSRQLDLLALAVVAVAAAGAGWLTVHLIADGHEAPALATAVPPLALTVLVPWRDAQGRRGRASAVGLPAVGLAVSGAVTARLAVEGDVAAAWLTGALGAGVLPLALWAHRRLAVFLRPTVDRRGWYHGQPLGLTGGTGRLVAMAAVLVMPAWAVVGNLRDRGAVEWLDVVAATAGLLGTALVVWWLLGWTLVWLRPGADISVVRWVAEHVGEQARVPAGPDWARRRTAPPSPPGRDASFSRPLAVTGPAERLAERTGLEVDRIWPRVALATSAREARSPVVALLRLVVAAAPGATLVLAPAVELRWVDSSTRTAVLVWLLAGPPLAGLLALAVARRLVIAACVRRAELVDLHKYALVELLRLPVPAEERAFARLADMLAGDDVLPGQRYEEVARRRPLDPADLADQVSSAVAREVRRVLDSRMGDINQTIQVAAPTALDHEQLERLAATVSYRVSRLVEERLARQLTELQGRAVGPELAGAVQAAVAEAVHGPPLANFAGYLLIELAEDQPAASAVDGTITAPAGAVIAFDLTVVRDERARDAPPIVTSRADQGFFVLEPVSVEGGRELPTAAFDALVDSATLTPLPHRRSLRTTSRARATFRFRLPAEGGRHEVWFQLYQGGRLIQVVALTVVVAESAHDDREGAAEPDGAVP